MKVFKLVMACAVLFMGCPALAQGDASPAAKPSFFASQSMTAAARVQAINHETREVTLLFEDGELLTSQVDDEVRNLDQVSAGDVVYAHYTESISIQVIEGDGADPESFVEEDLARTAEGRMPGIAATESAVTVAIVQEINMEDNTFKLREPDGEIRQYTARNPENLRASKIGDKVITTVTKSVVVTVDKQPAE